MRYLIVSCRRQVKQGAPCFVVVVVVVLSLFFLFFSLSSSIFRALYSLNQGRSEHLCTAPSPQRSGREFPLRGGGDCTQAKKNLACA